MNYAAMFETTLGWVGVLSTDRGLERCTLPQPTPESCVSEMGPALALPSPPDGFGWLERRYARYFEGECDVFADVSIDVSHATPFQRAAWAACRTIPAGETRTYKWLAEQAGNAKAFRAAGQTMANNPLPIIVPCHRVVGSDGSLRGYGSGAKRLGLKRKLLELETNLP